MQFDDLNNLTGEKYFLDWSLLKFDRNDFARFKGKNINQKIELVRAPAPNGFGIPILLLDVPSVRARRNPDLNYKNPDELLDWVKFYENPANEATAWTAGADANAQYLPPYLFNSSAPTKQKFRPGMKAGQIHLSVAASDLTIPHEVSHQTFQSQVFPYPIKMKDGRLLHVYIAAAMRDAEKQSELDTAVSEFNKLNTAAATDSDAVYRAAIKMYGKFLEERNLFFVSNVLHYWEEMLLFKVSYQLADVQGLTEKLKKEAFWAHVSMLMQVSSVLEDITHQDVYKNLVSEHKAERFDETLLPEFERLAKRVKGFEDQLPKFYGAAAAICMKEGYWGVLQEMEKAGRVRLEIEGNEIKSVKIL
jgi:hypothetical protein